MHILNLGYTSFYRRPVRYSSCPMQITRNKRTRHLLPSQNIHKHSKPPKKTLEKFGSGNPEGFTLIDPFLFFELASLDFAKNKRHQMVGQNFQLRKLHGCFLRKLGPNGENHYETTMIEMKHPTKKHWLVLNPHLVATLCSSFAR